jgi:hypothetical protein
VPELQATLARGGLQIGYSPALTPAQGRTFCPYKGLASYYDIGQNEKLALEPGQAVIPHGIDRRLDPDEVRANGN